MTNSTLKNKLQEIANQEENSIEKQVALEALNYDEIKNFFSDIMNQGCINGMVSSLIYYSGTHVFFDTHYSQIEELREEYEQNYGVPFAIKNDLKNALAWFAFEQIAYRMTQELELEI
jgi:hypothetical protein